MEESDGKPQPRGKKKKLSFICSTFSLSLPASLSQPPGSSTAGRFKEKKRAEGRNKNTTQRQNTWSQHIVNSEVCTEKLWKNCGEKKVGIYKWIFFSLFFFFLKILVRSLFVSVEKLQTFLVINRVLFLKKSKYSKVSKLTYFFKFWFNCNF